MTIVTSRRAVLAGAVTLPALTAPAALASTSPPATRIAALCETIRAINAEYVADSEAVEVEEAAAEAKLGPVPDAIRPDQLSLNPDLAGMGEFETSVTSNRGYISGAAVRQLVETLRRGEQGERVEDETAITIRLLKVPNAPSAADLARADRLDKVLAVAENYDTRRNQLLGPIDEAHEARQNARCDRTTDAECELLATPSQSTTDLLAKARLYETDPDRFSDGGPVAADGDSLPESIIRDVIALFGKAVVL